METRHRLFTMLLIVAIAVLSATAVIAAPAMLTTNDAAPSTSEEATPTTGSYVIVDTGQTQCYDDAQAIACPEAGAAFAGQDAQYDGAQPSYVDNGDGTVTDLNTGLMWQQTPGERVTFAQAVAGADTFSLAGYDDWRLPTIKELYSLIDFSGVDPSGWNGTDTSSLVPFIDTDYFDFEFGDTSSGERIIDAQYWSSTEYVETTMGGSATTFGVNFADGRIKGYGREYPGGGEMTQFVRYVRGDSDYGANQFVDNGDGTVTDLATGLMWMQADSGSGMDWQDALAYAENLELAGYDDWRLPNAKELQSIVDYSRSPGTTNSAAIDPVFASTPIVDEAGDTNYGFYWSSTTHANTRNGGAAAYVAFGDALGYMRNAWIDVHGAGAQRSDPKSGDPAEYPTGHGPQGDAIRIYNFVRAVRNVDGTEPNPVEPDPDASYSGYFPIVVGGDAANQANGGNSVDMSITDTNYPTTDALTSQPPSTGEGSGELPAGEGAGEPPVGGRVISIDGNMIQVENPQGAFTIVTGDSTEYRQDRSPGSLSAVAVGKFVGAFGQIQDDGTLAATLVIVSDAPPEGVPPQGGEGGPGSSGPGRSPGQ